MKTETLLDLIDKFAATIETMIVPTEDFDKTLPGIQGIDPAIEELKKKYPRAWLDDKFWQEFVNMSKRLKVDPLSLAKVIRSESNFDPKAVAKDPKDGHPIAKGLNQIIRSTGTSMLGMPVELWNRFEQLSALEQLPWTEKYFAKVGVSGMSPSQIYVKNFGGLNQQHQGETILYMSRSYMDANKNQPFVKSLIDKGLDKFQEKAYNSNKALDKNNKGYIAKSDLERIVGK
jgi:hypothetical protein